jgi:hypothetical protein
MAWKTSWLRVIYVLPSQNSKTENWVTDRETEDICREEEGSFYKTDKGYLMQEAGKDQHKMFFIKTNTFTNYFKLEFDPEVYGIYSKAYAFHSDSLENGPADDEMYNKWNFTDNYFWDSLTNNSFWYSSNTTLLQQTNNFVIGEQQIEKANLELTPQKFTMKDKKLLQYFPLKYGDIVTKNVAYSRNTNMDENNLVPIKQKPYNSYDIMINLNFDYTE